MSTGGGSPHRDPRPRQQRFDITGGSESSGPRLPCGTANLPPAPREHIVAPQRVTRTLVSDACAKTFNSDKHISEAVNFDQSTRSRPGLPCAAGDVLSSAHAPTVIRYRKRLRAVVAVTALARAWLADPGATQEIVLKGCDAVSDVCVLGAVSHGGVSGKLVIGYGRR
jgi:hypothetical protein